MVTLKFKKKLEYPDEIPVSVGVLQSDSLSPLSFILFMADIEDFFRSSGVNGLNINGYIDILLLLYADHLIILAHPQTDLKNNCTYYLNIVHQTA